MKFNRNYITPFIALVFLVMAISGLLMFFHLFDGYTEVVHEYLGVGFVLIAISHIIVNWKSLRGHFGKGVFIPAGISVLLIAVAFVILERMDRPIDQRIIEKMVRAPIADAFRVLRIDYHEASEALENKGMSIGNSKSLEEIWISNDVSPEEVIDALIK